MNITKEINYYTYETAFGKVTVASDGKNIIYVKSERNCEMSKFKTATNKPDKLTDMAAGQLAEYFAGKRRVFELPLDPQGTKFQKSVWTALQKIPYGETRSYKQIAQAIKNHKACRAVGMANNKNPIWIIIPCHRVIGADGSLTGYGGGLEMKERLLKHESNTKN